LREIRGCESDASVPVWKNEQGEVEYRCPVAALTVGTLEMLRLYTFYNKGFLPNEGGVLRQSNKFIQAIQVLEDAVARFQKIEEDRLKKEHEQKMAKMRQGNKRWRKR